MTSYHDRTLPGRLWFWWWFHGWPTIRKHTFCRIGMHRLREATQAGKDLGLICRDHEWR